MQHIIRCLYSLRILDYFIGSHIGKIVDSFHTKCDISSLFTAITIKIYLSEDAVDVDGERFNLLVLAFLLTVLGTADGRLLGCFGSKFS